MPTPRRNGAALRPWPLPSPKSSGLTRSLTWVSTFPCIVHFPPARTYERQVGTCTSRPCRPVRMFACKALLCQPRAYSSAEPPASNRSSRPFQASLSPLPSAICPISAIPSPATDSSIPVYPTSPAQPSGPRGHTPTHPSSRFYPRLRSPARNNTTLLPLRRCDVFDSSCVMTICAGYCRRW